MILPGTSDIPRAGRSRYPRDLWASIRPANLEESNIVPADSLAVDCRFGHALATKPLLFVLLVLPEGLLAQGGDDLAARLDDLVLAQGAGQQLLPMPDPEVSIFVGDVDRELKASDAELVMLVGRLGSEGGQLAALERAVSENAALRTRLLPHVVPTALEKSSPIESPMLFNAGSCSAMPRMLSITCVTGARCAPSPPLPPPTTPVPPAP